MNKWELIMAVLDRVYIYSSPNMKDWTFESEFGNAAGAHGGVWECPDLFPLKIEGTDVTKWVMLVSINPGGPNKGPLPSILPETLTAINLSLMILISSGLIGAGTIMQV